MRSRRGQFSTGCRPFFEQLEDRRLLSIVLGVTNTLDSGAGSLRQAILDAYGASDSVSIEFQVPTTDPGFVDVDSSLPGGDPGPDVFVIKPSSALPAISNPYYGISINGRSQATFGGDTNVFGPEIVLDGSQAGSANGIQIVSNSNELFGLNIQRFGSVGVLVHGDGNLIAGNYIGTDPTGTLKRPNGWDGIEISNAHDNIVGGTDAAARNIISGNTTHGLELVGSGSVRNQVLGNYIGVDRTGTLALGNGGQGLVIWQRASNNAVGGTEAGAGNVISGNSADGVHIRDSGTSGNAVLGNHVGTDVSGTLALANERNGVIIFVSASGNIIGGSEPGSRNVISGNAHSGIIIAGAGTRDNQVLGNYVGTDVTGAVGLSNLTGITITHARDNIVGGTDAAARNVISGNTTHGVQIVFADAVRNQVLGNYIGVDRTGALALGNTHGVAIHQGASSNTVGGTEAGAGNVISGNSADGVHLRKAFGTLVLGNYVGTDASGTIDLGNGNRGVSIWDGASGNIIGGTNAGARNVISGNDSHGVLIATAETTGNTILGNYIGVDQAGALPLGNLNGVAISQGASGNTVGGTEAGAGNVISGNVVHGVVIVDSGTDENVVAGNYIGLNAAGDSAIANGYNGVVIADGARGNLIGTDADGTRDAAERNVLSGNTLVGVWIHGVGSDANTVAGNFIGTNPTGTTVIANGREGVAIGDGAKQNVIGTNGNGVGDEAERNIISGNLFGGVSIGRAWSGLGTDQNIVAGNFIGTDVTGTSPLGNVGDGVFISDGASSNLIEGNVISDNAGSGVSIVDAASTGNRIEANSIYSNDALGIDLGDDGVTANDATDLDTGPNNLQNYPLLTYVLAGDNTVVQGMLDSTPNSTFTLDFFGSPTADPSGFGEGKTYLGSGSVTTDATGNGDFRIVLFSGTNPGEAVAATATDPSGNTSEFSAVLTAITGGVYVADVAPHTTLNAAADHVEVAFNVPVDLEQFTADDIVLTGPSGPIPITSIQPLSGATYALFFDPLPESGEYNLVLGPNILDEAGNAMDQNLNMVLGETEDAYLGSFTADVVAPYVVTHQPAGDIAGTIYQVDIWFNETIDQTTFSTSDVVITAPGGQTIAAASVQEVGLNRFQIGFLPQTTAGIYHIEIGPNIADPVGNLLNQDGDGTFGEPLQDVYDATFNYVSVDLQVSNVVVDPSELWAGESVTVSWEGSNASGAALLGDWTDGVYLSQDDRWDITDTRLATVDHPGGLTQDQSYAASATSGLSSVLPGSYYILVRADVYNQEGEFAGEENNVAVRGPLQIQVRELPTDGTVATGELTQTDPMDYFAVHVAPGSSIRVTLDGLAEDGSNELYISFEAMPSRQEYYYRAASYDPDQELLFTGHLAGGTYYVLVFGKQVAGSTSYTLSAEETILALEGISPALLRHSPGFYVGSFSEPELVQPPPATVTITGTSFDEDTVVEFIDSEGQVRIPTHVELVSPSTMIAELDLSDWLEGNYAGEGILYDVRVVKGAVAEELPDALEVDYLSPPGFLGWSHARFSASLEVPERLRAIGRATVWIEYTNTGPIAIPSPVLTVTASDGALITADYDKAFPFPSTFDWPPEGIGSTIQVLATGSGATPGILQPGDSGRLPFYYVGLAEPRNVPDVSFGMWAMTQHEYTSRSYQLSGGAIGANMGGAFTYLDLSIDWNDAEFKDTSRPRTTSPEAWDAIWDNFSRQIGPDWGDYVVAMADNATHLYSVGQETVDIASLWSFEIAQASAALNPISQLAGSIDAYSPAPGIPLAFSRTYDQPIASRYALGPLGRGWQHNWDIRVEDFGEGNVFIHGPSGKSWSFNQESSGTFVSSSGSLDTLTLLGGVYVLTEADQTSWHFRADLLLDYVRDANDNRVQLEYPEGRLTALTHSNGDQLLFTYNGAGRLFEVIDPQGLGSEDDRVTVYGYDETGEHLTSVLAPGNRLTEYTYESNNGIAREHALSSVIHPDDTQKLFAYDDYGRVIETSLGAGDEQLTYSYDTAGEVAVTDAAGNTSVLGYGIGGVVAKVRDGEGNVAKYSLDKNFGIDGMVGASGEEYRHTFDASGHLLSTVDALRYTTSFTYDPSSDQVASVTDPKGQSLVYDYDSRGNLRTVTYEDGTQEGFTYDAAGNVETWTNRRNETVSYTHNAAGQVTSKDYADTLNVTDYVYTYDAAGNMTSATDPTGTTTFEYDAVTDDLVRIEYPGGQWFSFGYDEVGRRIRREDQDGNVLKYAYDTAGRLDQMTDGLDALIVDYDYDTTGQAIRKTLGNGVYTTYDYDAAGQVIHLVNLDVDHTILSRFDYTYDASGRRTSMTTLEGAFVYGYDPLGQLTNVTYPDGHSVAYRYDSAGNRITVVDDGVSSSYSTNAMNQYTNVGGATYTFDDDGNLTSKTEGGVTTTYEYDAENRLVGVATPTDTWTYTYDALGTRVASSHNGTTTHFIVDPSGLGNVAAEYDSEDNLIARYDHALGLVSRTGSTGDSAYYTFDALGSTSELVSSTGAIANSYAYDPFGMPLNKTETIANAFEFVGQFGVMNEGNGLEFMRARYYDPESGRFTQPDPIGVLGGLNLYSYTQNNPASLVDPTGHVLTLAGAMYWLAGRPLLLWGIAYVTTQVRPYETPGPNPVELVDGALKNFADLVNDMFDYAYDIAHAEENNERAEKQLRRAKEFKKELEGLVEYNKELERFIDILEEIEEILEETDKDFDDEDDSEVRRSWDPNDKLSTPGYGPEAYVREVSTLEYQIRFENKAEAGAPAARVVVTDTLDADLDLSTFELVRIEFANQAIDIPPGLDAFEATVPFDAGGTEILVDVGVQLDIDTRVVTFSLLAVDPSTGWMPEDPLIGILYPNDETHRGEGSIRYRVTPKADLASGTQIHNEASIVFDYNDPIETPVILNTIDSELPASHVHALPAEIDGYSIDVSWTGTDDAGGAGIASYDVYVSEDGGEFRLWLEGAFETSATYNGEAERTYAFYSVAEDWVGHRELIPATPDAQTTLLPTFPPPTATDDYMYIVEDTAVVLDVLANDTDGDGNPLTYGAGSSVAFSLVGNPQHGELSLNTDQTLTYTPAEGFSGSDQFSYGFSIDSLYSNFATVKVFVGVDYVLTVEAGADQTISEGDLAVLAEAYFVYNGDPTNLSLTINWGDGVIEPGTLVPETGGGTIADTHTYADNGQYVVTLSLSQEGGVPVEDSLTVTAANVDPVAVGDLAVTEEDLALLIPVLNNDSDVAGILDPLKIVSVSPLANGSATVDDNGTPLDTTDDRILYTPTPDFAGTAQFTYTIDDGDGGTATATVTVTVLNLPDLSGVVFDDLDNDGLFETLDGEAGIGGVTMRLVGTDDLGSVNRTVLTDDGLYVFDDLRPGSYTLSQDAQPAGLLDGKETAGALGGTVNNLVDSNAIDNIFAQLDNPDADEYNFGEIRPSRIQGLAWEDFNDDGEVNFAERAIEAVAVRLTGTDDRGAAVEEVMATDSQGLFEFVDLRPSNAGGYTLTETQPAGYVDGKESLGTVGGVSTGTAADNVFSGIAFSEPGSDAINYNFGERPQPGSEVHAAQAATIGFWQNKNGQGLINSLNGGANATQLGNWMASTFSNMYGGLAGMTNAEIGTFYQTLFKRNGKTSPGGPPKLDAQVMAVALAVYVTNETLAGPVAANYGFEVTTHGLGIATFDVGDENRDAFGLGAADSTVMTVLDILLATNALARNSILYDTDGNGVIDSYEQTLRTMANEVFTAINEQGDR